MGREIFVRDLASSRHSDRKNAVRGEFRDIWIGLGPPLNDFGFGDSIFRCFLDFVREISLKCFSSFLDQNDIIVDEFVEQIEDVEALGYPCESKEDRIGFASGLHALRTLPRHSPKWDRLIWKGLARSRLEDLRKWIGLSKDLSEFEVELSQDLDLDADWLGHLHLKKNWQKLSKLDVIWMISRWISESRRRKI